MDFFVIFFPLELCRNRYADQWTDRSVWKGELRSENTDGLVVASNDRVLKEIWVRRGERGGGACDAPLIAFRLGVAEF
jgi:hypothetical protein